MKKTTDKGYSYVAIRRNDPAYEKERALVGNNYNPRKKYAYFNYLVHADGSESLAFIKYENDLEELQNIAKEFESWYNYPMGIAKYRDGTLVEL